MNTARATRTQIVPLVHKLSHLVRNCGDEVPADTLTALRDYLEQLVDSFPRPQTEAPPTVAAYFLDQLGAPLEVESDPSHPASPAHPEFTIETGCGEDCKHVIDDAAALIDHIHVVCGNDHPELVRTVQLATAGVVACMVYG